MEDQHNKMEEGMLMSHQHHSEGVMQMPSGHMMMGHGHAGNDHSAMINDFKKRFLICLSLTLPVLLLSRMIQELSHFHLSFTGDYYLLLACSSVIFFYGGWPFLIGLVSELKARKPGMMTLIAVAISTAYLYSSAVVFGLKGMDFFWEVATLIDIMLLGHWIEMKSVAGASRALELLVKMMPASAHLIKDTIIKEVKTEDLLINDAILIKPGEKIPADGTVIEGESSVNESMLTGESKPVLKTASNKVIGGSVNGNGSLTVQVTHRGKDSYLSKVINLVSEAQKAKSTTQQLADKAALWLTIIALVSGFATLFTWLALGKDFSFALERMVTVMVICCPHALGLAIPLVVATSTSLAAQKGLLIRNRTAFENSRKISTIVFDKTGTLTTGQFGVTRYEALNDFNNKKELLRIAASLEKKSEHPIAQGILVEAKKEKLILAEPSDFRAIPGKGVEAVLEGKKVKVVSPGYLKENNIQLPVNSFSDAAETIVFILIDERLAGYFALADTVRPESAEAIKTLKENGIKTIMLTGDNKQVAESVSKKLGLDGYFAEVLPHQKLEKIKELQQKGEFVAMTGDGVNDAPALAQADVGIAVGSGTDVAAETADIILVNSNPKDIVSLILFGKATYKKMIQNLLWATAYNVVTMPLAAGVLYNEGIVITPAIGAVFMSLSTVVVAINAKLLKA